MSICQSLVFLYSIYFYMVIFAPSLLGIGNTFPELRSPVLHISLRRFRDNFYKNDRVDDSSKVTSKSFIKKFHQKKPVCVVDQQIAVYHGT